MLLYRNDGSLIGTLTFVVFQPRSRRTAQSMQGMGSSRVTGPPVKLSKVTFAKACARKPLNELVQRILLSRRDFHRKLLN